MKTHFGLRSVYRAQLKEFILSSQLDFSKFRPIVDSTEEYTLEYNDTGLKFTFGINPKNRDEALMTYTIDNAKRSTAGNTQSYFVIKDNFGVFTNWLNTVIKPYSLDEATPDPWYQFSSSTFDYSAINNNDESTFTVSEQNEIIARIDLFESKLFQHFELSEPNQSQIKKELEYLSHSTRRLNKRDFKSVFFNIMYNIGLNIAAAALYDKVPPAFFDLLRESFQITIQSITPFKY